MLTDLDHVLWLQPFFSLVHSEFILVLSYLRTSKVQAWGDLIVSYYLLLFLVYFSIFHLVETLSVASLGSVVLSKFCHGFGPIQPC